MHSLILIATIAAAAISAGAGPQPNRADEHVDDTSRAVDSFIKAEMERRHIPGLALAVLRDGNPVKMLGYGLENVELNAPVTTETVFQIQSVTKQFTATAIMMLVEEGKVGLDDRIGKYLDGTPSSWGKVTVRRLLTHTSGIKDFINEPTASLRLDVTEEEVLKATAPRPLNFPVGSKYAYSNTGYHLLGMIIHKVSGKTWGEFVIDRICKPLGMDHTRLYTQESIVPNRASGYRLSGTDLLNGEIIAPSILAYAGGGLLSTVSDLCKWDAALYTEKVLKRASLDAMWTSGLLNDGSKAGYGFGWLVGEAHGHRFVDHGGAHATGFTSHIVRYIDDHLTVIVLTNLSDAEPHLIARGIANIFIPGVYTPRPIQE